MSNKYSNKELFLMAREFLEAQKKDDPRCLFLLEMMSFFLQQPKNQIEQQIRLLAR